jgi:hypothetical protein
MQSTVPQISSVLTHCFVLVFGIRLFSAARCCQPATSPSHTTRAVAITLSCFAQTFLSFLVGQRRRDILFICPRTSSSAYAHGPKLSVAFGFGATFISLNKFIKKLDSNIFFNDNYVS